MEAKYAKQLKSDLIQQFRGKPKIEALVEVVADELEEVSSFIDEINKNRDVYNAVGVQLDGVGNIADISRVDAAKMARIPISEMDDELYRKYIIFKILKNTCQCTYRSLMAAIHMFWSRETPVRYAEDPDFPATIIFDIDGFTEPGGIYEMMMLPLIRAAGVGFRIRTRTDVDNGIYLGIIQHNQIENEFNVDEYVIPDLYTDEVGNVLATELGEILTA